MKLLIAVLTCQRDRPLYEAIRSSWSQQAKAFGVESRFFIQASTQNPDRDEIHLACGDTRADVPYKVREVCKWALGKQIDYLFVCYANTVPYVEKIQELMKENPDADYIGHFNKPVGRTFRLDTVGKNDQPEHYERCYPWANGSLGYLLSRKAYTEVAAEYPSSSIDDLWVGQVLGPLTAEGEIISLDIPSKIEYSIYLSLEKLADMLEDIGAIRNDESAKESSNSLSEL